MKSKYLNRITDKIINETLEYTGAVLIEGPKWCGKTRTGTEIAKSAVFLQDQDKRLEYLRISQTKPSLLLEGEVPLLLDEWQDVPVLWDAVRFAVDQRGENGQFILTGSAVPVDNQVQHTGTGRIARVMMRPMSLFESGESNGTVSLNDLFNGEKNISSRSAIDINGIIEAIVRGGWPQAVIDKSKNKFRHAINYVDGVINSDINRVDGIVKNPARVRLLLRSLARNISTTVTIRTICDDIAMGSEDMTLSDKTVNQYLNALERIFVVENIPAWNVSLRSKTAIRTSPKRQFVDPSIAVAVMRLTPERLLHDFNYLGFLFESLVDRDLRVYIEAIDGQIYHYRDSSGLETDAILSLNDGRWALVEIKLGIGQVDEAAKHLLQLRDKIKTDKIQQPSFMMIVTGTDFAYCRDDGVLVVPIGCLRE